MTKELYKKILAVQKNEITEHIIYEKLSKVIKNKNNQKILSRISKDELNHYNFWKNYSKKDVAPNKFEIWWYFFISRLFGLVFGLKLMEKGEKLSQVAYKKMAKSDRLVKHMIIEENKHEKAVLNMINEDRLNYIGSMVLGLNDALVELTGALAGLTLALLNTKIVAMAGLITGIAASFSMAASEYLSAKSEENIKNPLKASVYTGLTYIFTVLLLIFPYLIFKSPYYALGMTISNAIIIIFIFTFYISVAKDLSFKKRFFEMAGLNLIIATITFAIGFLIRIFLNIEV